MNENKCVQKMYQRIIASILVKREKAHLIHLMCVYTNFDSEILK